MKEKKIDKGVIAIGILSSGLSSFMYHLHINNYIHIYGLLFGFVSWTLMFIGLFLILGEVSK